MEFSQRLTEGFPDLFGAGSDEGDVSEGERRFQEQNGWYNSIYALAGGVFKDFDEVERKPISSALRYLSYEKKKTELENKRIEKSMKR